MALAGACAVNRDDMHAEQQPPEPANFCACDDETTTAPRSRAWTYVFLAIALIGTLLQPAYGLGWLS